MFNPLDANAWQRWSNDFDNTARLFASQFQTMQQLAPYVRARHPEMLPAFNSLLASGARHQATLATLNRTRNDVGNWLSGIGRGVSQAAGATMSWLRDRFGLGEGMGVAPLVAIVGVGAAAAALVIIARWIRDAFEMSQRLNALYRLEQSGVSAQEAASIVNRTLGSPAGANLFGIPWIYIIGGVVAIAVLPQLLANRRAA